MSLWTSSRARGASSRKRSTRSTRFPELPGPGGRGSMSARRRIESFLDLAAADAAAALLLAASQNRYAAYHVQQAVEKLVKAVLVFRGTEAGVEHHLDVLIGRLTNEDAWKTKL